MILYWVWVLIDVFFVLAVDMNRDTEELPAIIKELEDDVINIESSL